MDKIVVFSLVIAAVVVCTSGLGGTGAAELTAFRSTDIELAEDSLAINFVGGALPIVISAWLIFSRKIFSGLLVLLISLGALASFAFSRSTSHGVLLIAFPVGLLLGLVAGLLFGDDSKSVAAAFSAGAIGVFLGADVLRVPEGMAYGSLMTIGAGGLKDGIMLVAALSCLTAFVVSEVRKNQRSKVRDEEANPPE